MLQYTQARLNKYLNIYKYLKVESKRKINNCTYSPNLMKKLGFIFKILFVSMVLKKKRDPEFPTKHFLQWREVPHYQSFPLGTLHFTGSFPKTSLVSLKKTKKLEKAGMLSGGLLSDLCIVGTCCIYLPHQMAILLCSHKRLSCCIFCRLYDVSYLEVRRASM